MDNINIAQRLNSRCKKFSNDAEKFIQELTAAIRAINANEYVDTSDHLKIDYNHQVAIARGLVNDAQGIGQCKPGA